MKKVWYVHCIPVLFIVRRAWALPEHELSWNPLSTEMMGAGTMPYLPRELMSSLVFARMIPRSVLAFLFVLAAVSGAGAYFYYTNASVKSTVNEAWQL